MNQVIKELYDIETQARETMENAGLSKQQLQEEKRRQMDEITVGLAAELEGRMTTLQAQLEEQAKEDICKLVENNQRQMEQLNAAYRDNLSGYAQEIVRKTTEV